MKESEFQAAIVDLATICGWLVFHPRPAQARDGRWITAFIGHAGFPDLVLAHERHGIIFAELKTRTGIVTNAQAAWLAVLDAAGGYAVIWRPDDWPEITRLLQEGPNDY